MFWNKKTPRIQQLDDTLLFRCDNDQSIECLQPLPLHKMHFGCFLCNKPERFDELSDYMKARMPRRLSDIWTARVLCDEHYLPMLVRCPNDRWRIDPDGWTPPLGIWGDSTAGKTVYCAALMMEIERLLNRWTGMTTFRLFNERAYKEEVVDNFKNLGLMPDKTLPQDCRTLVIKLKGKNWPSKKITLTDMSGETFKDWFSMGAEDEHLRIRRQLILRTREAIFLASPESSLGLRSTMRRDLWPALGGIGDVYAEHGTIDHYSREDKQRLLNKMKLTLRYYKYPIESHRDPVILSEIPAAANERMDPLDALRREFENQAYGDLAIALGSVVEKRPARSLVRALAGRLDYVAKTMNNVPDLKDQLSGIAEFIRSCGLSGNSERLDMRIAVVISKADLVRDVLSRYDKFPWDDKNFRPSRQEWRRILKDASDSSKRYLADHGEQEFIDFAERTFNDVGFFFVSSCGRDIEEYVLPDEPADAQPEPQHFTPLGAEESSEGRFTASWRLQKIIINGPQGGHQPDPKHVMLPLLWLLAGGD